MRFDGIVIDRLWVGRSPVWRRRVRKRSALSRTGAKQSPSGASWRSITRYTHAALQLAVMAQSSRAKSSVITSKP